MKIIIYLKNGKILDYSNCELQELNSSRIIFKFYSKSRPEQQVLCWYNLDNIAGFTMDIVDNKK